MKILPRGSARAPWTTAILAIALVFSVAVIVGQQWMAGVVAGGAIAVLVVKMYVNMRANRKTQVSGIDTLMLIALAMVTFGAVAPMAMSALSATAGEPFVFPSWAPWVIVPGTIILAFLAIARPGRKG